MEQSLNKGQKLFVELMTDDNYYTNEQLAELCEVDVRTIYRWKKNNSITEEINRLADASLGQYIHTANKSLIELIEDGSEAGRLKGLDILYKTLGKYKETNDVTITENKSVDEKKATLLSRLKG